MSSRLAGGQAGVCLALPPPPRVPPLCSSDPGAPSPHLTLSCCWLWWARTLRQAMFGPEERRVEEETLGDHFQRGARKEKLPRAPGARSRVARYTEGRGWGVVLVQPQGPRRPLARNPEAGVGRDFPLQARVPVPARHLG